MLSSVFDYRHLTLQAQTSQDDDASSLISESGQQTETTKGKKSVLDSVTDKIKDNAVSLLVVPTVVLITSLEKPVVDFILDGIICSCPCLIIIFLGDVVTSRLGGGTLTQLVHCLTSLDLCVTLCCKIADCICQDNL